MPTKGKSNLYGRGKRGEPNDHISYKYSKLFLQGDFDRHYKDHGQRQMGLSEDQYRSRAIAFANQVDRVNHVSFVNEKGLTIKYSLRTSELAMVTREGNVATYFRTNIKEYERWKREYERRK